MKLQNQLVIILTIALMLTSSVVFSMPTHDAEAKKTTTKKYSVQIKFINACSCTPEVTVRLKDDDKQTIATRVVDLGRMAGEQDEPNFYGPKIPVTDQKDQHPNEITACMKNSHVNTCKHIQGSGNSYSVTFDSANAGREF